LLGAPGQASASQGDIKTPDFKSYFPPQPAGPQEQNKAPLSARKRKEASESGALDDSGKSFTPSSDEKKSTSSEIRGRGAPTPIASTLRSGRLSEPPVKRRKLEMQATPCPGLTQGERVEDGERERAAHGSRLGADVSLSFRDPKFMEGPALHSRGAFGSDLRMTGGLESNDGKGVADSSQGLDLSGRLAQSGAQGALGAGLGKASEERSSGGSSKEYTRLGDESGSGQHVSQDRPPGGHSGQAEATPEAAPGEAQRGGAATGNEAVGELRPRMGTGKAIERDPPMKPGLERESERGFHLGAGAGSACPCGDASKVACRACEVGWVEAALVLCRYQLLCLWCPVTEAQDGAARERPPFDQTDLALLKAQMQALPERLEFEQGDFGPVLEEAGRFLEQRPGLLHLTVGMVDLGSRVLDPWVSALSTFIWCLLQ
jgi:hypothetical protein